MADDRWQVLSDWLSEWLEADPRAKVRLRDKLAVNHPELVGEADRMSASADSLTGFLDTPALVLAARELVVDAPVLPRGATVGPYRVVQLLARGGMGDVYRATDSRLGRDVALKVLSPGRTRSLPTCQRIGGRGLAAPTSTSNSAISRVRQRRGGGPARSMAS